MVLVLSSHVMLLIQDKFEISVSQPSLLIDLFWDEQFSVSWKQYPFPVVSTVEKQVTLVNVCRSNTPCHCPYGIESQGSSSSSIRSVSKSASFASAVQIIIVSICRDGCIYQPVLASKFESFKSAAIIGELTMTSSNCLKSIHLMICLNSLDRWKNSDHSLWLSSVFSMSIVTHQLYLHTNYRNCNWNRNYPRGFYHQG